MSDDTSGAPPLATGPQPRYFAKEGAGVQVVYNLRDDSTYRTLGYREIDEQSYLANLPDPTDIGCAEHLTD
ncbi:hypothetical protein ITI46_07800 [Streptomyces oryzae]|uniref:Uncharacterized protein n=1 Tax=Streptomyces oryzae TaxID=1434886 RepID=A0ABS3X891_9ACTN|nr:hypothetical protein [Streptomyces oryzae]MBO8191595.1 hypothetical protein [Streptomyces oryzae]